MEIGGWRSLLICMVVEPLFVNCGGSHELEFWHILTRGPHRELRSGTAPENICERVPVFCHHPFYYHQSHQIYPWSPYYHWLLRHARSRRRSVPVLDKLLAACRGNTRISIRAPSNGTYLLHRSSFSREDELGNK